MKNNITKSLTLIQLLAAATIGCDGQTEDDYLGEPLMSISGTISSELEVAPEFAVANLSWTFPWDGEFPEGDEWSQGVTVSGDFPSNFTLDLLEPPPEFAFQWEIEEGPRMAYALLQVTKTDSSGILLETIGTKSDLHILYIEPGGTPASDVAQYWGVYEEGFHLIQLDPPSEAEFDECTDMLMEEFPTCDTVTKARTACVDFYLEGIPVGEIPSSTSISITLRTTCDHVGL